MKRYEPQGYDLSGDEMDVVWITDENGDTVILEVPDDADD